MDKKRSDQEQLEAAWRNSEQVAIARLWELEAIYISAPIGLCFLDTQLRYIRINQRLAEINGFSIEEHLGRTVRELLPSLADEVEASFHRIIQTGEPILDVEVRGQTPAQPGVERTWLEQWLPLKNQNGEVIGINIVAEEITERKQQEAQLQHYQQQLEMANKELTDTNDRLARAIEEIQESNLALKKANEQLLFLNTDLDNFIYSASHDLKAPILNIQGLLQLLEDYAAPELLASPEVRGILNLMNVSVDRFKKTISDLTEVAHSQKFLDQPLALIDIREIIQDVLMDVSNLIEQTKASISVELPADTAIRFSAKNLRTVVYNLLANALKYRDPNRMLLIGIELAEDGEYKVLRIRDNGLGMDLKSNHKLFGMFSRLHDHVEGSGIGLYIVKKVVTNYGGKIEVDSQVGKGSTFSVFFKR